MVILPNIVFSHSILGRLHGPGYFWPGQWKSSSGIDIKIPTRTVIDMEILDIILNMAVGFFQWACSEGVRLWIFITLTIIIGIFAVIIVF